MKLQAIIHKAEEGGYWAYVPAIPGCATQGETLPELRRNIHEAVAACLTVETEDANETQGDVMELHYQPMELSA